MRRKGRPYGGKKNTEEEKIIEEGEIDTNTRKCNASAKESHWKKSCVENAQGDYEASWGL